MLYGGMTCYFLAPSDTFILRYAALLGDRATRFFVLRDRINVDRAKSGRPVTTGRKRACYRHYCVNRREFFSARAEVVELGKGEERQQIAVLASLSWLFLMTLRFLTVSVAVAL